MDRGFVLLTGLIILLFTSNMTVEPRKEVVQVNALSYDSYGHDCGGGISIKISKASNSKDKIGKTAFIKSSIELYKIPEGLIASGNNKINFYGRFQYEKCKHLMGDGNKPKQQLFFIYDSIDVYCPFKYYDFEGMKFDTTRCERHQSFHERIRLLP